MVEPNIRHPGRHRAHEVTLIRDLWRDIHWIPGRARNDVAGWHWCRAISHAL